MNLKVITKEELLSLDKNTLNMEITSDYLQEYSLYIYLLLQYLLKTTDIKKYDDLLANDKHNFIPLKQEEMDIYQKLCSSIFKYFYIRNNIYIERLSE